MYPLTLAGRVVVLREFRPDDVDAALAISGDDRVTRWLSYDSRDRAGVTAVINDAIGIAQQTPRTQFFMAGTLPDNGPLIGFGRLALDGVQAGKIGWAIRADRWGRGYGSDVGSTLATFGFRELRLHPQHISTGHGARSPRCKAGAVRFGGNDTTHQGDRLQDQIKC